MKKIVICIIFLLSIVLGSCGTEKELVYLYNFKPEANNTFKDIASTYEKETGVKVRVTTSASGQYESSLRSEIVKSSAPTIFTINGYVGYENWKDYTYDLSKTKFYSNLTENGKNMAIKDGDSIYAVPVNVEGYGLIYSKKVFDDYFKQEDRACKLKSIKDVKSFSQFKEIVDDLKKYINDEKKANSEAINRLKDVFATSLKNGSQWPYQTHLSNLPLFYEFREKSANTIAYGKNAKEIEFKYYNEFFNMFDLYVNNSVTDKKMLNETDYDTAIAQFAKGESAFIQQGNWAYSNIMGVSGRYVQANDLGMIPIFIGAKDEEAYTIPVGTENYWCINKNASSKQIEASINFINWLFTSTTGIKLVNEKLGFLAPFESFANVTPHDPLSKIVFDYINNDKQTIEWTFQTYPSEVFKDLFGSALVDYTKEIRTKEDVKNIVIGKWKSEKG